MPSARPEIHGRGIGNAAALRKMHVDLPELGNDLFWFVSLFWHEGLPVCVSHNIRVDHFKRGGSAALFSPTDFAPLFDLPAGRSIPTRHKRMGFANSIRPFNETAMNWTKGCRTGSRDKARSVMPAVRRAYRRRPSSLVYHACAACPPFLAVDAVYQDVFPVKFHAALESLADLFRYPY